MGDLLQPWHLIVLIGIIILMYPSEQRTLFSLCV